MWNQKAHGSCPRQREVAVVTGEDDLGGDWGGLWGGDWGGLCGARGDWGGLCGARGDWGGLLGGERIVE